MNSEQRKKEFSKIRYFILALSFCITLFVFTLFVLSNVSAQAPQEYDYAYEATNVYADRTLSYEFDNLDSETTYTFTLQAVSPTTGNVTQQFQSRVRGPGVTSANITFTNIPNTYFGPAKVVDQFGNTLGEHFISPAPQSMWTGSADHASFDEKTAIGQVPQEGQTFSPEFPMHDFFSPDLVTTEIGDYILLHYRSLAPTVPEEEFVVISRVSTGSELARISVTEMFDYNLHPDWSGTTGSAAFNFVVLNTSDTIPEFVNQTQNDSAFDDFDNPHALGLTDDDTGVYDYARLDDQDELIAAGDSVWILADHGNSELECTLSRAEVLPDSPIRADVINRTERVFDDYGDQALYAFEPSTPDRKDDGELQTWSSVRPVVWLSLDLIAGAELPNNSARFFAGATDETMNYTDRPQDYEFNILCGNYDIVEQRSWFERIMEWMQFQDEDDQFIVLAGALGVVLFGFAAFARWGVPKSAYLGLFLAVSVAITLIPVIDIGIKIMVIGLAIIAVLFTLKGRGSE